jgi:hypothetical protein
MSSKYEGEVTEELRRIYHDAWKEGIWIKEFGTSGDSGIWLAGAGSLEVLRDIERETGKMVEVRDLLLGDCVLFASPGTGKTREEACLAAIKAFKESRIFQSGKDRK